MKQELTLLGVWNMLLAGVWIWQNEMAVRQLTRLTGRPLGTFCYIKNNLNYECFLRKDTDQLKADLDALSFSEQMQYVQKIADDYYLQATPLEQEIIRTETAIPATLSDEDLALLIQKIGEVWPKVTMQIWYAVLLDIWYPSPEEKTEIKEVIAKARDHCGHLHERSSKAEHNLYLEAAKRLQLSEQEIYFMNQPEIAAALRGKPLSSETLQSRIELCVLSTHTGVAVLYGGKEAQAVADLFEVPTIGQEKKQTLQGTPASRGTAEGKARVILLDSEFPQFQEGEILVSLQTMVHYVPIMKKAKAILTEFGGLTSHAVIVSRELGKPAVVGIKHLISSVHTGDLLHVDAQKGIVRILSK